MPSVSSPPASGGSPCAASDSSRIEAHKHPLPVWPLRTEEDYRRARAVVDGLALKGEDELLAEERDQLEIFSTLMEHYEERHHPITKPDWSPVELLRVLLRESGMSASDLGRLLGDRSLGHRILAGERSLSKSHIKTLSEHFHVDAGAFLS